MSTHSSTTNHDPAHLSLGRVVLGLLGALSTLWKRTSRRRAAGLGRELRDRTVRWFTEAWSGTPSTLGLLPELVVRRGAEPMGFQHLRCMRWLALRSARDDDAHSAAA